MASCYFLPVFSPSLLHFEMRTRVYNSVWCLKNIIPPYYLTINKIPVFVFQANNSVICPSKVSKNSLNLQENVWLFKPTHIGREQFSAFLVARNGMIRTQNILDTLGIFFSLFAGRCDYENPFFLLLPKPNRPPFCSFQLSQHGSPIALE